MKTNTTRLTNKEIKRLGKITKEWSRTSRKITQLMNELYKNIMKTYN